MEGLTAEKRRLIVGQFYSENRDKGKGYTVHHFVRMNMQRRSIYNIISRVESGKSLEQ